MPIRHRIYEELGVVLSTLVDEIVDEDLLPAYRRLYEDERWKPGFHEIVDMRESRLDGLTGEGLRDLSKLVVSYTAGKCHSFMTAVVAPDDLPYGLSRMYCAMSETSPEQVQVFRSVEEACVWLGVDPSVID